jgi:hypothetical protein
MELCNKALNMNRSGLVLVLAALGLLLASCEKEISENLDGGKKVEIFFSMNAASYHTAPDVMRNGNVREPTSRTIYLNDEMYLRATLEPDSEDALRLSASFIDGQRICFKAFDVSVPSLPVETDSKIYSYSTSAGKFIPLTTPLGVEPDGSTPYRFVAYSYFGEADVTPDVSNIDPIHDLVWGKTLIDQSITDTETSRTVSINMEHQFAQVKVKVRSSITNADITDLSGVKIGGGKKAALTPFDGAINWNGTDDQGVDPFTVNSTKERESEFRTVTPVETAPVRVTIGSVKVSTNSSTFSNKWTLFDSTLDPATRYTLVVDLRRGNAFAYSNVYWDDTKLTFDATDKGHRGYQGLLFKWGSLVGISPVGQYWTNDGTPIYKAGSSAPTTAPSWGSILVWDSAEDVGTPNTGTLKGDICKYINAAYRMPRQGEFGTDNGSNQTDWVWVGGSGGSATSGAANEAGRYDFNGVVKTTTTSTIGEVALPLSGFRDADYGVLLEVGIIGGYWYGTYPIGYPGVAYPWRYDASHSNVAPYGGQKAGYAYAIRCVRN